MSEITFFSKMEQAINSDLFSNIQFTDSELGEIVDKATFYILYRDKNNITNSDSIYVALAIVNLSKNYSGEDSRFWEYIFKSLLLPQKQIYQNYIYAAIEHLYVDYLKRDLFTTQTGRTSYYSTILAHALAPKDTLMSLFKLLYNIYVESLMEVYIKNDIVTKLITERLKNILEHNETTAKDILKIDSLQYVIRSSIRYLITYEPHVFIRVIDNVFSYFDGQDINMEFGYLNLLLEEWSRREKIDRREKVQKKQRIREQFSSFDKLKPRYQIVNDNLTLVVPNIHLEKDYSSSFRCEYSYCGIDRRVDLYTFGNSLVKNIRSFSIDVLIKYIKEDSVVGLNIKIFHGSSILYDSEEFLYFTSILLKDNIQVKGYVIKPGFYSIFTTLVNEADSSNELTYKFRNTYTLSISDDTYIRLGDDLWSTGSESEKQDIIIRTNRVPNFYFIDDKDNDIEVIQGFKSLKIVSRDLEKLNSVRVLINNEFIDLALINSHNIIELTEFPDVFVSYGLKKIAFINLQTQERLSVRNYFVIPDCKIEYSQPIFYEGKNQVKINGIIYKISGIEPLYLSIEDNNFRLELPFLSWSWRELSNQISKYKDIIWIGDISTASPLIINVPPQYFDSTVMSIENISILRDKSGSFALGEALNTNQFPRLNQTYYRVVAKADHLNLIFPLFDIYYKELFLGSPYIYKDGSLLSWDVTDSYVGSKDSKFKVDLISNDSNYSFEFCRRDEVDAPEVVDGIYSLKVFRVSENAFLDEDILLYEEDEIVIGDENINRFKDCTILINKAQLSECPKKIKLPEYKLITIEYLENNGFPEFSGQLINTRDHSTLFKVRITIKDNHVLWLKRDHNGALVDVNVDTNKSTLTVKPENGNTVVGVNYFYYKED